MKIDFTRYHELVEEGRRIKEAQLDELERLGLNNEINQRYEDGDIDGLYGLIDEISNECTTVTRLIYQRVYEIREKAQCPAN